MTGRTHLFVGAASALAVTRPSTTEGCLTAMTFGALGGLICDIDMRDNRGSKQALYARLSVMLLIAVALVSDTLADSGVIARFKETLDKRTAVGAAAFIILCIIGVLQPHRKFTHSAAALILFSCALAMVDIPLCVPFAMGFVSHLALDILNRKKLQLFWPLKTGVSFNICYSNKLADKLFFTAGVICTAYFAGIQLFTTYYDDLLRIFGK